MGKLNDLTITQARDGLAAGDFSAVELTDDCITAMEAARDLNIFITETPDIARDRAARAAEPVVELQSLKDLVRDANTTHKLELEAARA